MDVMELYRQGNTVLHLLDKQRDANKENKKQKIKQQWSFLPEMFASAIATCCVSDNDRRVLHDIVIKTRYSLHIYNENEILLKQHLKKLTECLHGNGLFSNEEATRMQVCIQILEKNIQPEVENNYYVSMSGN